MLRKLGVVDANDVRDGFAAGDISKEMLEAEGLKSVRITRLQRVASMVMHNNTPGIVRKQWMRRREGESV